MDDLSLHILDLAENSVTAGATRVEILLEENEAEDVLRLEIRDNGRGMPASMVRRVLDPFVTSRTTRRVGLGLPMLAEAARMTGGKLEIDSEEGRGTIVRVTFGLSHIDRQPVGNVGMTIVTLVAGNPEVDFHVEHTRGGKTFRLDTEEMRSHLGEVSINHPTVLEFLRRVLENPFEE